MSGDITILNNGTFKVKNGGEFTINTNSIIGPNGNQTLTVEDGGLFKTGDKDGFSGDMETSIHSNIENVVLEDNSTVEYSRSNNQIITAFKPLDESESNLATGGYYNLKLSGDNGSATAKKIQDAANPVYVRNNLQIEDKAFLKIEANKALIVKENIINNGEMLIESDGILIQKNDLATFTGKDITAKRNLSLTSTREQYNYLISPLVGYGMKDVYKNSSGGAVTVPSVLYHSEATNKFYSSSGAYIPARALAVKEPAVGTETTDATFRGKPFNGEFDYQIVNTNTSDVKRGFNLVGNPYPSNMDLIAFYVNNGGSTGGLSSTFYLWDSKANNQTAQAGDNYGGQSYAIFNVETPPTSGTGTKATGDTPELLGINEPVRYLKSGQGFMVQTTEPVMQLKFKNNIRTHLSGLSKFFGKNQDGSDASVDRYWLNMISPNNVVSNIAIVYFPEGNNAFTKDDSRAIGGTDAIYSMADNEKVTINGRSSFTISDIIPLGASYFISGNYTIALSKSEGLFESSQDIYLKDKLTNNITNLSRGQYTFSANAGEDNGRFEIIYQAEEIILVTNSRVKNGIVIYRDGTDFIIKSPKIIAEIEMYDLSGKMIMVLKTDEKEAIIDVSGLMNGTYVLKITSTDGEITNRKIVR